ncbi:MAG: carboxylesterase [SAR86 cluster bacterium]|uniref:Carboxylesterase n=1 Tax=SAR86 cluster bacterium TaxID=2030880 RepID=A0A2A4MQ15_9GAMM|nr:MAG: carboxylesterase [SAR86 cluster bacterium]
MQLLPAVERCAPANTDINAAVIWLHGLGADGNDFAPIIPQLKLSSDYGIRFVFPHSPSIPVSINNGMVMPAWYDISSSDIDRRIDTEGLVKSAKSVQALIDREIERGIDSSRIILAGFSQGGAVAYEAGLSYAKPLAGIMALSTYFATAKTVTNNQANKSLPILVCHGVSDPVVVESKGRDSVTTLQSMGFTPEYLTYPMEHAVCPAQLEDISKWLVKTLG